MKCPRCGCERFEIAKLEKSRKFDAEKRRWLYSSSIDTRKLICTSCEQIYWQEQQIACAVIYDPDRRRAKLLPIDEYKATLAEQGNSTVNPSRKGLFE